MTLPRFKEINQHHISPACAENLHDQCDGVVYGKEWNQHQHDCECLCHQPPEKGEVTKKRIARAARRRINHYEE